MYPLARTDDLTVRALPDETLVYDHRRHKAHCLNATAALVWQHCDGRTSADALAGLVAERLGVGQATEVVGLALEQLGRRHLLEEVPPPLPPAARLSRRDALKKLALAAAALPIVLTIATRAAAQTLSEQALSHLELEPPILTGGSVVKKTVAPPGPCRTRGQNCVAAVSRMQGNCCAGLRCNNVSEEGAGVCG